MLCPRYVGCTVRAEFSPEAWEFFQEIYLRNDKPCASTCYRWLTRVSTDKNWVIPSYPTVLKRIRQEIPYEVRVLAREGEQGLMEIYPAQERSVRDLHALEWINGDGYEHNVFVKWPDGTIHRPKTWFWQDVYSRKLLAWRTGKTENTDLVRLSFGDLVERNGYSRARDDR